MELDNVIKFLHAIRVGEIEVSEDESWVRCSCPLAAYTHEKGTDSNPSFAIVVNDSGESSYNCFSCGNGSLRKFIHRATWTCGIPIEAQKIYSACEVFEEHADVKHESGLDYKDKYRESLTKYDEAKAPAPVVVLMQYPLIIGSKANRAFYAKEWLNGRGIPDEVVAKYQIRFDPESPSVIFPLVDTDGKTYALHGRSIIDKSFWYVTPKAVGLTEQWGRKDGWFGIQHIDFSLPVIVVESETDVLVLESLGITNSMACCGGINKEQLNRVATHVIYLGFDSDLAGVQYCLKVIDYFRNTCASLTRLSWKTIGLNDAGNLTDVSQYDEVWKNRKVITRSGGVVAVGGAVFLDKFAMQTQ